MGIDAVDIYGLSEVMGPGVANECVETKDGPVIWEDHFYPRSSTPKPAKCCPTARRRTGVHLADQGGLPIIRYRTRDLTRLLPPTARSMRRMGKITGRSDDMLIIRGVNVFPTQIEELVLQDERLSPHYMLEVTREGRMDELAVQVELKPQLRPPRRRAAGRCEKAPRAPHQDADRRQRRDPDSGSGRDRAFGGQGQAGDRQAAEVDSAARMTKGTAAPFLFSSRDSELSDHLWKYISRLRSHELPL
jgi:hypothetical protein